MNGVLFIDEAYGLLGSGSAANYGAEAISVLLKEMEDRRGRFCSYSCRIPERNGRSSVCQPWFRFQNPIYAGFSGLYPRGAWRDCRRFLKKKRYEIDNDALARLLDVTEYFRQRPNFSNARTVRNILDQVILNQNLRAEDNSRRILGLFWPMLTTIFRMNIWIFPRPPRNVRSVFP